MTAPHITYVSRPNATQEGELNALAAAYRFIIDCQSKKRPPAPLAPTTLRSQVNTSPKPLYPEGRTEFWVLFDLRDARTAEELHQARAVWQGQSDIEALDEDHFVLILRAGWVSEHAP